VFAFIIKKDCEVKETFSYEVPFNETTQQSLVEYTHANYGPEAMFRQMTDEEKADFTFQAQDSIETKW
jgi:hypothetical protein